MIWPFKRTSRPSAPVFAVYNAIVAQSRQPRFYTDWSVPDTVTGRFDMICLHMCLVLRRLRAKTGEGDKFAQDLFDLFFKDMDRSLREMGVNDVAVPKRIQKMGNLFYGLLAKLTEAVDSGDTQALTETIDRNIFDAKNMQSAAAIAGYTTELVVALNSQSADQIIGGKLSFESQTAPAH